MAKLDDDRRGAGARAAGAVRRGSVGWTWRDPFVSPVTDFFLTNPIARASKVMAEASALAQGTMRQAAE